MSLNVQALQPRLMEMLAMQDTINKRVNPQWVAARYPFLRAVFVEGAEALDHYGWKWWKHQSPDMAQLHMELVDIWHFAMSHSILKHEGSIQAACVDIITDLSRGSAELVLSVSDYASGQVLSQRTIFESSDARQKIEAVAGMAAMGYFSYPVFFRLMEQLELSFDALFKMYVAKNILNLFRQDHGYQEGTYKKVWAGREDNEHLVELLVDIDFSRGGAKDVLYAGLKARYASA